MTTTADIVNLLNDQHRKIASSQDAHGARLESMSGRILALEQTLAGNPHGGAGFGGGRPKSLGEQVTADERFKDFVAAGARGSARIKAEISFATGVDTLAPPDRSAGVVGLAQRRLVVRDLLPQVPTTSDLVQFARQTSRDNQAAAVAHGATKPESDFAFELAEAPVRTIAHVLTAARQTLEDAPALAALINSEMTHGVDFEEEGQILMGDGLSPNLFGLIPAATIYSPPISVSDPNRLDELLAGAAQIASQSGFAADAFVVNDLDFSELLATKDNTGRYVGGGPFAATIPSLAWGVRIVPTPSLDRGEFLVGAFRQAATIYDRMAMEVIASSEHADNFTKNLVTIRAEKRLALAIRRPDALVTGEFTAASS